MSPRLTIKNIFRTMTTIYLAELQDYSLLIEQLLEGELIDFNNRIKKLGKSLGPEEKDELYEFYSEDYFKIADFFPNIMRSSLFVTCYTLIEHRLLYLCNQYRKKDGNNIPIQKYTRGNGIIKKYQKYLKNVLNISFPDQTNEWKEILNIYKKLRNTIVHNNGYFAKNKIPKEVVEFVKDNPNILSISTSNRIEFNNGFIEKFLKVIKTFFYDLGKNLPN